MTLIPNTDSNKKGMQNKCCNDNIEFYYQGDGVEWEMWECSKCKLKYVIPIEIQRYFAQAKVITHMEDEDE